MAVVVHLILASTSSFFCEISLVVHVIDVLLLPPLCTTFLLYNKYIIICSLFSSGRTLPLLGVMPSPIVECGFLMSDNCHDAFLLSSYITSWLNSPLLCAYDRRRHHLDDD